MCHLTNDVGTEKEKQKDFEEFFLLSHDEAIPKLSVHQVMHWLRFLGNTIRLTQAHVFLHPAAKCVLVPAALPSITKLPDMLAQWIA